jgi:hypothetical protein
MATNNRYPDINLTINQEFTIETVKRTLPSMSRQQIEDYLIEIIKQRFAYENAFKAEIKKTL